MKYTSTNTTEHDEDCFLNCIGHDFDRHIPALNREPKTTYRTEFVLIMIAVVAMCACAFTVGYRVGVVQTKPIAEVVK